MHSQHGPADLGQGGSGAPEEVSCHNRAIQPRPGAAAARSWQTAMPPVS